MMSEENLKLTKGATKAVVGSCVGLVVKNAIKSYVPGKNKIEQIQVLIGAYVLASMIGDHALTWADGAFDRAVKAVQEYKTKDEETADA